MKINKTNTTKMQSLLFFAVGLILCISPVLSHSQTGMLSPVTSAPENKDNSIRSLLCKYFSENVYIKIKVNGITENTVMSVERSIDGINFENIGYVNIIGSPYQIDLLYCFTDESPLKINSFYRVSGYKKGNESFTSEIVSVIPQNRNDEIVPPSTITFASDTQLSMNKK